MTDMQDMRFCIMRQYEEKSSHTEVAIVKVKVALTCSNGGEQNHCFEVLTVSL